MIPGTTIKLGETKYLVPPLNFAAMKKHKAFIASCMKGDIDPAKFLEDGDFERISDIAFLAIKRNYPKVTVEEIEENLDASNLQDIFNAIMKVSGFEEKIADDSAGK